MIYKIEFSYNGFGEAEIEAKSKKEAEDKFYEGTIDKYEERQWGENYEIIKIKSLIKWRKK